MATARKDNPRPPSVSVTILAPRGLAESARIHGSQESRTGAYGIQSNAAAPSLRGYALVGCGRGMGSAVGSFERHARTYCEALNAYAAVMDLGWRRVGLPAHCQFKRMALYEGTDTVNPSAPQYQVYAN